MAKFVSSPQTFRVHEVPAYEPSGTGSHVYVWIEKQGMTTAEAIRGLAGAVGVDTRDVGYGGMKDKHATTWQWLSFPESAAAGLPNLALDGVRVLKHSRHANKLRVGHVNANHFDVTLTEVAPTEAPALIGRFEQMLSSGIPNRYGQQRFGFGNNVTQGLAILTGKFRERDRRKRTLLISAVQSAVFNRVLAQRAEAGTLRRVLPGDVLQKTATGGVFTSIDADTDQARLDSNELHTTGPLPGLKAPQPAPGSVAEQLEQAACVEVGLTAEILQNNVRDLPGTRRPLILPIAGTAPAELIDDRLTFHFSLPAGAYATVVVEALLGGAANKLC